jgi:hypothetical protein
MDMDEMLCGYVHTLDVYEPWISEIFIYSSYHFRMAYVCMRYWAWRL